MELCKGAVRSTIYKTVSDKCVDIWVQTVYAIIIHRIAFPTFHDIAQETVHGYVSGIVRHMV